MVFVTHTHSRGLGVMLRDAFFIYFFVWGVAETKRVAKVGGRTYFFFVVFVKTALKFMEGTTKDNAVL